MNQKNDHFNRFIETPKISLIQKPTPVHKLEYLGKKLGVSELWIKREDLTSTGYGGNKVRNLEYILGEAKNKNIRKLITAAPKGSNFIAALAYHGSKNGFNVQVEQFCPTETEQILSHNRFSIDSGASITKHSYMHPYIDASVGYMKSILASNLEKDTYRVPTGGSCTLGVLGHVGAFLEMAEQMKGRMPEQIIVGVGTCGTIAGLHCGAKLLGLKTKIIGIRCVDPIMANKLNIYRLIQKTLSMLQTKTKASFEEIKLMDPDQHKVQYVRKNQQALEMSEFMKYYENVLLDTTYTSKVILGLKSMIENGKIKNKRTMYWHTFNSNAI